MYLGTNLDPHAYYEAHSSDYSNPHSAGILHVLERHKDCLGGRLLDMGCGPGLISKVLHAHPDPIVGVDSSPVMVARYQLETGRVGQVGCFWDPLPTSESAVFCYSLHLCPPSRVAMVEYRLMGAGVKRVLVISPLKARAENWLNFECVEESADRVGPDGKTIYGRVYRSTLPKNL